MFSISALFAFSAALGFKLQDLTQRRLQEAGISPLASFSLYRYALIPAVVWSCFFVDLADLQFLLDHPRLLAFTILIAVTWNFQSLLHSFLINSTSSMSLISTIQQTAYLPFLFLVGIFFNRENPNWFGILALFFLLSAICLQPSDHAKNRRSSYALPVLLIGFLAFFRAGLDAYNNGMTREVLLEFDPAGFLGIFAVSTLVIAAVISLFLRITSQQKKLLKKQRILAIAFPLIWFAASVPETWGYADLPIYTMVMLGSIVFLLDLISDLRNSRIRLSLRTVSFAVLTFAGIVSAMLSA